MKLATPTPIPNITLPSHITGAPLTWPARTEFFAPYFAEFGFKYPHETPLQFKSGVIIWDISPDIRSALAVITWVTLLILGRPAIITSVRDSTHSKTSLHYLGYAIDLRCWNLSKKTYYAGALQWALDHFFPNSFQVIIERTHIHIELDPLAYA